MKKIILSEEIKERHRNYIFRRKTDIKLKSFFKDKIWKVKICEEKGLEFYKEHCKFIYFLIEEILKLDSDKLIEKNKKYDYDCNIFTAKPENLDNYIKDISCKFPILYAEFIKNDSSMTEYTKELIGVLGYNDFCSDYNLNVYYRVDEIFSIFNSKNSIKEYLKANKSEFRFNVNDYRNVVIYYIKQLDDLLSMLVDDNIIEIILELRNVIEDIKNNMREAIKPHEFINRLYSTIDQYRAKYQEIKSVNETFTIAEYNKNKDLKKLDISQWGAYHYVFSIGLKVCPYCNRQYITPVYTENGMTRGDLDHFFAKTKYPYLSMSIYNLVPCCKVCNSSLKLDKEFTYENNISPFDKGIEEILEFDFQPTSYESFYGKDIIKILLADKAQVDEVLINRARNNCNLFKIEELYQYHSDVVKKLILMELIYSDKYIEYIYKMYGERLKWSKEEIKYFLIAPYLNMNDMDQPLAVLVKDIINSLKKLKLDAY